MRPLQRLAEAPHVCLFCRARPFLRDPTDRLRARRSIQTTTRRQQAGAQPADDTQPDQTPGTAARAPPRAPRWGKFRPAAADGENDVPSNNQGWGGMRSQGGNQQDSVPSAFDSGLPGTIPNQSEVKANESQSQSYDPPPFRQAPTLDNPHFRAPRPEPRSRGPLIRTVKSKASEETFVPRRRRTREELQSLRDRNDNHSDQSRHSSELVQRPRRQQWDTPRPWGEHLKPREATTGRQEDAASQNNRRDGNIRHGEISRPRDTTEAAASFIAPREEDMQNHRRGYVGFQNEEPSTHDSRYAPKLPSEQSEDTRAGAVDPANETSAPELAESRPGVDAEGALQLSEKERRRAARFASTDESQSPPQQRASERSRSGRQPSDTSQQSRPVHSRRFSDAEAEENQGFRSFRGPRTERPARRSKATQAAVSRINYAARRDSDDFDDDRLQARERRKQAKADQQRQRAQVTKESTSTKAVPIEIPAFVSIQNLAALFKVRPEDFSYKLDELGFRDVNMDYVLNGENAALIAMEYNFEPNIQKEAALDLTARPAPADKSVLPQRPPIVTIMGHVDHGKTTLLDYLRHSSVAASEHGGITQHIGAFSVPLESHDNRLITFLDTPGHSAFLTMRQRGANVTDIVVLVVAADDSVKPQTIEAIKHSRAAGVQIIVAINKVDKDEADVQRVKQDLMRHEIEVEDFGGDIQAIEVSGKTGQGVADLEEAIITLADVLDTRAETDGAAEGWVLEASTKRAGRTATVLVRRGTLKVGDIIVAGKTFAKVRTMRNEAGTPVPAAAPGTPVEIDGWRDQPMAGDEVLQAPSEQKATAVIEFREARDERVKALSEVDTINEARKLDNERRIREKEALAAAEEALAADENATRREKMEARKAAIFEANKEAQASQKETVPELFIVVKADVSGSAEAVAAAIDSLPLANQPIKVSILRSGVGAVNESDVALAAAAPEGQGYVLNFNQVMPQSMSALAARSDVTMMDANIIYKVIDDVREKIEDWLPPVVTARVTGETEVLQAFEIKGERKTMTKVAGCRVNNGIVARNSKVRVYRGEVGNDTSLVFDGTISSLRSQKKDVPEMRKGTECGLSFLNWDSFLPGDIVQCYEEKSERRRLL